MAGMENPDVFSAGGEDRVEETKYVQGLKPFEQKPTPEGERLRAYDTMREYVIALDAMPEYIRNVTKEMDQMRMAGLPDPAAYEKLKDELAQKYEQFSEISMRMVDLAHDTTKPGDAAGKMASLLMQEDRRDEVEDAYRAAVLEAEKFVPEAEEPMELYEQGVQKLMAQVADLEVYVDLLERKNKMNAENKQWVYDQLDDLMEQLQTLDETTPEPAKSRERRTMVGMINGIREQLAGRRAVATAAVALTERGATEEESLKSAELLALYDEEVQKLLADAVELEDNVETFAKDGTLQEMRPSIDAAKAEILVKLKKLDGQKPAAASSRERDSLIGVLSKLDEALEEPAPIQTAEKSPASELYDKEVRRLYLKAVEVHDDAASFAKKGKLEEIRPGIRAAKDAILEKLEKIDAQRPDAGPSRERDLLMQVLAKIDEVLEQPAKATAAASPLAGMRATHQQVRAQYAAVQHALTDEQRRAMRSRIAQMSVLVRQAEDDAWRDAFGVASPPPPPEPPAPAPDIRSAIVLAISRASEAAGAIAEAVDVKPTPTPKRGLLGALGDAFKLK